MLHIAASALHIVIFFLYPPVVKYLRISFAIDSCFALDSNRRDWKFMSSEQKNWDNWCKAILQQCTCAGQQSCSNSMSRIRTSGKSSSKSSKFRPRFRNVHLNCQNESRAFLNVRYLTIHRFKSTRLYDLFICFLLDSSINIPYNLGLI